MWHPEEADVEHAVGHEARQVQGNEVEAETNHTVGWGDGRQDLASEGMGGAALPVQAKEGLASPSRSCLQALLHSLIDATQSPAQGLVSSCLKSWSQREV